MITNKETLKNIEATKDKISKAYKDKDGNSIRKINGVEVIQCEDEEMNSIINMWRIKN